MKSKTPSAFKLRSRSLIALSSGGCQLLSTAVVVGAVLRIAAMYVAISHDFLVLPLYSGRRFGLISYGASFD